MRKSFLFAGFLTLVLAGVIADRGLRLNASSPMITVAEAAGTADQSDPAPSSTLAASKPSITLANGQVLNSETLGPLIEKYLLDHPEVLAHVAAKLQEKQDAAAKADAQTAITALKDELLNKATDPVLGNPRGDVTVVEFFDYKCPYCKRVADDVSRLIRDDPQVRVVFKEFPILGPDSQIAALGGLAANLQGKYGAYHEAAMSHHGPFNQDVIEAIAKDAGLDMSRFQADMKSPALFEELKQNQALAQKLSIDGTPGFIIGQEKVPGAIDYDEMKKLVDEARKTKS